MDSGPILSETVALIREILGSELERITVERAVIGLFFTGAKLSTGHAGACATPLRSIREEVCSSASPAATAYPGKLRGRTVQRMLGEIDSVSGIHRAAYVAVTNALAQLCWERRPSPEVELRTGVDAYDAAQIRPGDNVVVVGAFVPFLKALKQADQRFTVLELNPATLKPDELPHFRPADEAASVLPTADVVLITGTTLLNGTLEGLLALAPPQARVVMVGPTVGLLPDPLLSRGVDVIGGTRIVVPDEFLDVLAEGGTGQHFLGHSAEKVVLVRRTTAFRAA
jgi:uncharacterized protein (DUF4213/DUF364 family)